MQQNEAFDLLKMGKNIFLTGAAGAGKTYLLNKYIKYLKENNVNVAVTASTGIAATHLHGVTIHSWSGMGVRESLSNKDLEKILANGRIKRNYKNTKVLIIDEISMLHKHQLDMVDVIARYVLNNDEPFGGMQVVVCGDFFQLPPVGSTEGEKKFAYEAAIWQNDGFEVCYLYEQHRQGDDPLLTVLNDIRSGTAGEHTKVPLRTRYKKEPHGATRATKLYSRNINVDAINEQELANINADERTFKMESKGWPQLVEGLKKSCLAQEQLKLKIGAEVMFIKNDTMGSFVNGTRGVVVKFENSEKWPVVKTYDERIIVVTPEDWKYEDNGVVTATITQLPLRLAWAITIHKSQGMTLDAAEMDLGDAFEPGMGYVALSRVRSLNGLKLMNLNEMALKVHPKILEQDKVFRTDSDFLVEDLNALSPEEITRRQNQTLIMRFGGSANKEEAIAARQEKERIKKEKAIPTHIRTLALLKENLSIKEIAEKRELTIGTVITHLEKLRSEKQLDDSHLETLKNVLPSIAFENILFEFKKSEDGKLQPIFEKFDGKYSYDELRVVRFFAG
jgi:hypothetical protein